jgi:aspartate 1-decarboxylase
MDIRMLKTKIHRATITEADLSYEGSITVDRELVAKAGMHEFEQVDVLNITNGARFTTYVILGKTGQICVNGAAARLVQRGDQCIIIAYCTVSEKTVREHKPRVVLVNEDNSVKKVIDHPVTL